MKRKLLFSLLFSLCAIVSVFAQRTVDGTVTSNDDGSPIPGVNVVLKGTTTGTTSDLDGNYRLTVPDEGGVLIFSFIGLVSQEVEIGARTTIDVSMTSDVQELETVVVTALGIEREARSLGYAVSGVESEELVKARETNILNALQGKVTGVRIGRSSGNLGGSSKILIRGVSSLNNRNNPLWVVDGVPISNAQDNTGDNRISGNRDFGNNAGLLNPDDIESINVLKGGAAAALYGSRAGAGVIVVTTKKGRKSKSGAPTVSFSTSLRFDDLFKVPDWQNEYSTGLLGKYDSSLVSESWGEPIQGQIRRNNILGVDEPLQQQEENYKDFFHTGLTLINNIAVSDADDRSDYRLSITSLNQEGILPGANLDRLTTSLNAGFNHSKNLKSRFSVQFVRSITRGVGVQGANDPNIFSIQNFGRSIDFKDFQDWADDNGNQIGIIEQSTNNPYWTRRENRNDQKVARFIGNYSLDYSPIENLTLKTRIGYDYSQDNRFIANAKGTLGRVNGDFRTDNINRRQLTIDGIANYNIPVNEDININILGGVQYNERIFEREINFAQDLVIAGLFQTSNAANNTPDRDFTEVRLYGVFEAEFTYKNWLTLTATARNDWSSTLPLENNSYFYPSISAAFVFTDAFQISNNILSYGKIRASWANIGNDATAYQLSFRFFPQTTANGQYGLNLTFPYNGVLAFGKTNRIPNAALVPENKNTIEFGTELGFFDGRVSLDATYFFASTTDQFFPAPVPESTGFATIALNAGEVTNEGIELSLNVDILQTADFSWSVNANFFTAESKVKELTEGVDRLLIASAFNSLQVVAEPGKEFQLFGIPYLRDSVSGRPIINPLNGQRQSGEARTFGSVFPEWQGGLTNNFSWKGINLGFTIDASFGGLMRSSTVNGLWVNGLVEETTRNRQGTFIDLEGVLDNGDGTFRDNDVPVRSAQSYWQSLDDNSVAEASIFDATYVKLREANISYTLPTSLFTNSPIKSVTVGVEGRNLALLYSTVPHIDPEANLFGSGVDGVGVERANVPSTRSLGFNLKLIF